MDPRFLVNSERIETAARLFERLRASGFDLVGAMWAQSEDDARPYLYLVTENIDTDGVDQAYLKFHETFRAFQPAPTNPLRDLDMFEIKLLAPRDERAALLLRYLRRYPDDQPTYRSHCSVPMEAAYIYPASLFAPPAAAQQLA